MKYNFDEIINREHTDCLKYEMVRTETGRNDLLPLWVADMDFKTPDFVVNAINKKTNQGILGYSFCPPKYSLTIQTWVSKRYNMNVKTDYIHYLPGIVPGIVFSILSFTEKSDSILIETPVYHPFRMTVENTGRKLVASSLILKNGRYEMDFEDLEQKLPQCKMMILCNPHNPGGFTWDKDTMMRLAKLCKQHNVIVVSDEIHADLTLPGHQHLPFACACEEAKEICISLMAPSKAFNMPGVIAAYCIVENQKLRNQFFDFLDKNDLAFGNIFAFEATCACYSDEGENWLNQMLTYVANNIQFTHNFIQKQCQPISMLYPEASFLIYLDNRKLNMSQPELIKFYQDKALLYLNDGTMFGKEGLGFMRLNVATPRSILTKALTNLSKAVNPKAS